MTEFNSFSPASASSFSAVPAHQAKHANGIPGSKAVTPSFVANANGIDQAVTVSAPFGAFIAGVNKSESTADILNRIHNTPVADLAKSFKNPAVFAALSGQLIDLL